MEWLGLSVYTREGRVIWLSGYEQQLRIVDYPAWPTPRPIVGTVIRGVEVPPKPPDWPGRQAWEAERSRREWELVSGVIRFVDHLHATTLGLIEVNMPWRTICPYPEENVCVALGSFLRQRLDEITRDSGLIWAYGGEASMPSRRYAPSHCGRNFCRSRPDHEAVRWECGEDDDGAVVHVRWDCSLTMAFWLPREPILRPLDPGLEIIRSMIQRGLLGRRVENHADSRGPGG
jgi:hypothetical protein